MTRRESRLRVRAVGLVLGYAADRLLGDTPRWHPVAGFGITAGRVERVTWRDHRVAGVAHTALLVGGSAAIAAIVARAGASHRSSDLAVHALATWAVLGGRSLEGEAACVQRLLDGDDLAGARVRVTHLVGRETDRLDPPEIARATVESVAENTSDAVVAPLLAGAVAGVPGLVVQRTVNTLDAMVGHRDRRYERFGWASARLDDLLNLLPARVTAALATMLAPSVDGRPSAAWRTWRRDARHHPSPNAGPVEASFAGALGVRLGGVNQYGVRTEERTALGAGRDVVADDIARSVRLAGRVNRGALLVCLAWCWLRSRRPPTPAPRARR